MLSRHTQRSIRSGIRCSPTNPNLSIAEDPEVFRRLTVNLTNCVDYTVLFCVILEAGLDTGDRPGEKE